MTWIFEPPNRQGRYLVIDKLWGMVGVGLYVPDMKSPWCLNGTWLAPNAVRCWQPLPPLPNGHDHAA